ncbi:hypothetical protein EC973_009543, partial [Apophysomyces ossiformis]
MAKLYDLLNNFSGSARSSSTAAIVTLSIPVSDPIIRKVHGCPKEIPYFQWVGGTVFQKSEIVFRDIEACLDKFED